MKYCVKALFSVLVLCLSVCSVLAQGRHKLPDNDIVIIYDNDVHGAFQGYSKIAALKEETLTQTPNVLLASMGDFSQGGPLCSVSKGRYALDVMNRCGYDIVTLGNHEFDYGLHFLNVLKDSLSAQIVLDNFTDLRTGQSVFPATYIREFGDVRIGFIGAVTPMTKQVDCPTAYIDEQGKDIYSFHRHDFFERIQKDIDLLKTQGADYVILLSHLGDNQFDPITSEATVANTIGLDAVIDGHAHHVIRERWLKDLKGDSVLLASTGCDFQNIGRFTITTQGRIVSELIPTLHLTSQRKDIADLVKQMDESIDCMPAFAHTPFPLASYSVKYNTYNRNCITNLGTLVADAFREMTGAHIGWVNSGSLRVDIPEGDITFRTLLATFPHQNNICVCRFKGSRILDALEYGVQRWPNDYGAFPVLSGMMYQIDPSGNAEILRDSIGQFLGIGKGKRRVANARVLNPATGFYEQLNPDQYYTIASNEYNLKHSGDGGILSGGQLIQDSQMKDVQLFLDFVNNHLHNLIPARYSNMRKEVDLVVLK